MSFHVSTWSLNLIWFLRESPYFIVLFLSPPPSKLPVLILVKQRFRLSRSVSHRSLFRSFYTFLVLYFSKDTVQFFGFEIGKTFPLKNFLKSVVSLILLLRVKQRESGHRSCTFHESYKVSIIRSETVIYFSPFKLEILLLFYRVPENYCLILPSLEAYDVVSKQVKQ